MEEPGLSIFQGATSLHLNSSNQHEEEEQEDLKRRQQEIKNALTNAFEDLDDDVSSINSSHNTTRESERHGNLSQRIAGYGNDYDNYGDNNESQINSTDVSRHYSAYGQTPYINKNNNSSVDSPYKLPLLSNRFFSRDIRAPIEEEEIFNDSYPYNYKTPANHYEEVNTSATNGYADEFDAPKKQARDYGGGDADITPAKYNNQYNGTGDDNTAYKTAEYESTEQLEVLYGVRLREIKRLNDELQEVKLKSEEEQNQLNRKLTLAQAEIERSNLSRNQSQNALVDAKAEIIDLKSQLAKLTDDNAVLDKTNRNLSEELSITKDSLSDLHQKIAVLERAHALHSNDKTNEKFLKQVQEKHAIEIKNMQTQIDLLTDKLNAKESAYVTLENKLMETRRANESLMVEKGDMMNRLSQALEESQAQCRNLLASNSAQEVVNLQSQLKAANQRIEELQKFIQELQHKLELAKSDAVQYETLLGGSLDDETDSIRHLKLGEHGNKFRSKHPDDVANKLRCELQRCLAGQDVKRKEINRLENILMQKEEELTKISAAAENYRLEAARYAKRVGKLEHELKTLLVDEAMKANAQIQKLSDHLTNVQKENESLKDDKTYLEKKLEETMMVNEETLNKLHQETLAQREKETVSEYNKEYLDIHDKAILRVRQEAQVEIVQLTVQLEETQKELDRVKQLYIEVCGTKEELIAQHKEEIQLLKDKYENLELSKQEIDKLEHDIITQTKIAERLTRECEMYKSKIVDLEKDLSFERKRKDEYTKKIHMEIEKAKAEALQELRSTYPDREISVILPDHCSEHMDKISQLENDCKRLEEKLSTAMDKQSKMSELESELDDVKLKIAQFEITQEPLKKKYEKATNERNDLLVKISKLESKLLEMSSKQADDPSDVKMRIVRLEMENESLRNNHESSMKERNALREKLSKLEEEVNFRERVNKSGELEANELNRSKDLSHLLSKSDLLKEGRKSEYKLEQRIKQLEWELQDKGEQLQKYKDFEKIKDERDRLLSKLKNQAMHFEQFVKSQKQVSAELNLSPRSVNDTSEYQKIKEATIREVREQMEQKVAAELRGIEEQDRKKRLALEEKYKSTLLEMQVRYSEKKKELDNMKMQEQVVVKVVETRVDSLIQELQVRQARIEELQCQLRQKDVEVNEEKNVMAKLLSEWAAEVQEIKAKETEMSRDIEKLRLSEANLTKEIQTLKESEREMKSSLETLKHKYHLAKESTANYKKIIKKKESFFADESKRWQEEYAKAIKHVEETVNAKLNVQKQEAMSKLEEIEVKYKTKLQMYKNKS